jgi:hypothetical protein
MPAKGRVAVIDAVERQAVNAYDRGQALDVDRTSIALHPSRSSFVMIRTLPNSIR